jgi:hypothetical protein
MSLLLINGLVGTKLAASAGLTLDTEAQIFTAESPDYFGTDDRRFNVNMEPGMVFDVDNEETVFTMARPWNSTYLAYAGLWKWSSLYGAYPAFIDIGESQAADNHLTPGIVKTSTEYCVFQEDTHKGNLDWFKVPFDLSSSVKQSTKTGNFSRVGIRKLGTDDFLLLHQNGTFNVAKTPFDGSTIGTPVEILTSATKRIYPTRPYGPEKDSDDWFYIPFSHTEADPGAAFPAQGLFKTQDWTTFYNIDETDSFTAGETLTNIKNPALKYIYLGDSDDVSLAVNLSGTTCIDADGNFFDVTILPDSNEITTTYFNGSAWVQNVFEPDGTIAGLDVTGFSDSTNTTWCIFLRGGILHALIRMVDGSFYKFHLFKSTDSGFSWTDHGDVTPGVDVNIYRAMVPLNLYDVPNNVNFPIGSSEYVYAGSPGQFGDFYITKAAFGSLQEMESFEYTDQYNSMSEFPSLYCGFESDDVNISGGTTISQLNDKSGNARHATAVGSPALTSGEIVCNGTSSAFQMDSLASTINGHSKATICFVGRGTLPWIFCLGKSTDDNVFCTTRVTTSKFSVAYRVGSALNTLSTNGVGSDISSADHIYRYQIDGLAVRVWIDGIEQNKTFSIAGTGFSTLLGKWGGLSSPNRLGIGVLRRSTNTFSAMTFRALSYAPVAYTEEEGMKAENFLADKYGITITR